MTVVFMFPGQSSRYPQMIERLLDASPDASAVLEEASAILGRDLRRHYRAENATIFATNRHIQVGVFLASHIFLRWLEQRGLSADRSLGLSLGEYNHLVDIGALPFADALRLVDARGQAYDAGPEGAMASVFPIDLDDLEDVVSRAAEHGTLEVANLNSPTQHVISGERAAVDAALRLLDEEYCVEGVLIEQRIPMHCWRFEPVSATLRPALRRAPWQATSKPYMPNVYARPISDPSDDDFVEALALHVYRPVRWRESIELLADADPDTTFVEVGPRSVLFNLLSRRWRPVRRFRTDSPDGPFQELDALVGELVYAA